MNTGETDQDRQSNWTQAGQGHEAKLTRDTK